MLIWSGGDLPYPAHLSAPITLTLTLSRGAGEGSLSVDVGLPLRFEVGVVYGVGYVCSVFVSGCAGVSACGDDFAFVLAADFQGHVKASSEVGISDVLEKHGGGFEHG